MFVKNETLKKLTSKEAQDLDLYSIGCMFVRGEAKARVKGYKTVKRTETEMWYEDVQSGTVVELIRLDSVSIFDNKEMKDWCVRVRDGERYARCVQPLFAINFVK